MATLAKALGYKPLFGGTGFWAAHFAEAATQSFVADEFVNLSSGKCQRIVAVSNNLGANDLIAGRAVHAASGTTNKDVTVMVATSNLAFELPCSTDDTAATTAITNLGTKFELRHLATAGVYAYNTNATTNTKVIPVGFVADPKRFTNVIGHPLDTVTTPGTFPWIWPTTGESAGTAWCTTIAAQRQLAQ